MKAWVLRHLPEGPWSDIARIVFITVLIVVLIWGLGANLTTESKTETLLRQYHAQTLATDKTSAQRTIQIKKLAGQDRGLAAQDKAIAADIKTLLTDGKSASALNAKAAKQDAAAAVKLDKNLIAQENTVLELIAVEQEELEAAFPGKTLKVTCGLSKANDLECKIVKSAKK